jgi:hypothetical protein
VNIDEKIKLLIKNRITLQEVMASTAAHAPDIKSPTHAAQTEDSLSSSMLKQKRPLYEEMFYLLQSKPVYLARVCRLLQPRTDSIALFVQTVVFDLFGDAYDSHEERLLLSLFKLAISSEMNACSPGARATLLRSNTPLTQMLSAYAKRGQGTAVLREILEPALQKICTARDPADWNHAALLAQVAGGAEANTTAPGGLARPDATPDQKALSALAVPSTGKTAQNLELQPLKIYQSLITDFETCTGVKSCWAGENLSTDEAALSAHGAALEAIISARVRNLESACDSILERILCNINAIPYGMRWICRTIAELYRARFGFLENSSIGEEQQQEEEEIIQHGGGKQSETRGEQGVGDDAVELAANSSLEAQVRSLEGGFLFLRFFTPALVSPETVCAFLRDKPPSRILRRNLVLVAKVIQNLSNGVKFGPKEKFMQRLNPWLDRNSKKIEEFFLEITKIEDTVDTQLSLDKYTASNFGSVAGGEGASARLSSLRVQVNQVYFMHQTLVNYKEKICLAGGFPGAAAAVLPGIGSQALSPSNRDSGLMLYSATDPLAVLLSKLGLPVPSPLPKAENCTILLRIGDVSRNARISTVAMPTTGGRAVIHDPFAETAGARGAAGRGVDPGNHPLVLQAKALLVSVLKRLPVDVSSVSNGSKPDSTIGAELASLLQNISANQTLSEFLAEQKKLALEHGNTDLCDAVSNVSSMLSTLFNMNLLQGYLAAHSMPIPSLHAHGSLSSSLAIALPTREGQRDAAYALFLASCCKDASSRVESLTTLDKTLSKVSQALATVKKQNDFLNSRLEVYRIYLDNVRQGQAHQNAVLAAGTKGKKNSLNSPLSPSPKSPSSSSSSSSTGGFFDSLSSPSCKEHKSEDSGSILTKTQKYSHSDLVALQLIHKFG